MNKFRMRNRCIFAEVLEIPGKIEKKWEDLDPRILPRTLFLDACDPGFPGFRIFLTNKY